MNACYIYPHIFGYIVVDMSRHTFEYCGHQTFENEFRAYTKKTANPVYPEI